MGASRTMAMNAADVPTRQHRTVRSRQGLSKPTSSARGASSCRMEPITANRRLAPLNERGEGRCGVLANIRSLGIIRGGRWQSAATGICHLMRPLHLEPAQRAGHAAALAARHSKALGASGRRTKFSTPPSQKTTTLGSKPILERWSSRCCAASPTRYLAHRTLKTLMSELAFALVTTTDDELRERRVPNSADSHHRNLGPTPANPTHLPGSRRVPGAARARPRLRLARSLSRARSRSPTRPHPQGLARAGPLLQREWARGSRLRRRAGVTVSSKL